MWASVAPPGRPGGRGNHAAWGVGVNNLDYKRVRGGVLVQERASQDIGVDDWKCVSHRQPTEDEYRARYPAFELTTQGNGDGVVRKFHSANLATPANRYKGSNTTYYQNPGFDDLVAQLYSSVDIGAQGLD